MDRFWKMICRIISIYTKFGAAIRLKVKEYLLHIALCTVILNKSHWNWKNYCRNKVWMLPLQIWFVAIWLRQWKMLSVTTEWYWQNLLTMAV